VAGSRERRARRPASADHLPPSGRPDPIPPPHTHTGLGVIWYNVGRQELHICKGPEAQLLPQGGAVELVMPGVEALAARLENVQSLLG
jgi:hypothetical protein